MRAGCKRAAWQGGRRGGRRGMRKRGKSNEGRGGSTLQRAFPISEAFKTDVDLWVFGSNEIPLGRVPRGLPEGGAFQENARGVSLIIEGQAPGIQGGPHGRRSRALSIF